MSSRRGRPPLPKTSARHRRLICRLLAGEEEQIARAAQAVGKTTSDWVRATLLAAIGLNPAIPDAPPSPNFHDSDADVFLD